MKILLTNDDGVNAPGLRALEACLPKGVEAVVVAPADEKSASSHSISLGQDLIVDESHDHNIRKFSVQGTPADCVKFAISELKDFVPDLIVSGINQGANTGVSVYYSGTISAAREGFINRIPAVAVSLCSRNFKDFEAAQKVTQKIIEGYRNNIFPTNVMLNINVPPLSSKEVRGVRVTKQAASRFIEEFVKESEKGNRRVYTLAGEIELYDPDGASDEEAVKEGYVSMTPLKLDLTEYASFSIFEQWAQNGSPGRG